MTGPARAARLASSAAAMGLVFMGAIVIPVYLVPALTLTLALGLTAESHAAGTHPGRWQTMRPSVIRYRPTRP